MIIGPFFKLHPKLSEYKTGKNVSGIILEFWTQKSDIGTFSAIGHPVIEK